MEMPLRKSNYGGHSFMGPSIWNKLCNNLKILNTATPFTHNYKKLHLKQLEQVEHNFNRNFYHYHHH